MFTGIIEEVATVAEVRHDGSNLDFIIKSPMAAGLKVDQSVSHNGVCLTVVAINGDTYRVTAVAETLSKTNLDTWKAGDAINLERALKLGDRLDGHFVQGHTDCRAECVERSTVAEAMADEKSGSWLYRFRFPGEFAALVIEKGSICINGVSLTAFNVGRNELTVTIIPYTYEHTNFKHIVAGSVVNMEFDVLGKYLLRNAEIKNVKM